ncbi:MAG: murein biosynthesis integral membrane protein MurJ [SAR324 cluster bacterium]|nr:murein biosynthesis integral membrane protein MurJ [SAR324 cluster bacterium]
MTEESQSIYRKVGLASLIMMISIFLSRIIGLVREMIIAYIGGAGEAVDAYQVAFIFPEILNHILASGFLSITFIPIFSAYLVSQEDEEGWRVFSLILTCFGSLLLILIVVAMLFTPEMITLAGFRSQQLSDSAVRMTRIIIPAQFFFFAGGILMAVQFAKEKFLIPALAPLIYNVGIIVGGVILSPWLGMEGFSWGVLAGALVGNFVIQVYGARRVGMRFRICFQFNHPDLKKYILLTLPLMLGLTMTFSTELFSRVFGSYLPEGSVSSLNYSLRIMYVLVGIFGQAAGVASYPFLARLLAEKKMVEMNLLLDKTLRLIFLVIPFSVLLIVLRHEVVLLIFQRGQFDAAATSLTADVLAFVLIGTVGFAAQTIVSRGYYASQNTLLPTVFGTLAVIASIPVYILGMRWMGVTGVALGLSLSALFQSGLLYLLWIRHSGNKEGVRMAVYLLKIVLVSAGLGLVLKVFHLEISGWFDTKTVLGSLAISLLTGTLFLSILAISGHLLGIEEVNILLARAISRLKKILPT